MIEQLAVGDDSSIEVPGDQAIEGQAGALPIAREPSKLRCGTWAPPHAKKAHPGTEEDVGARRLGAEVFDEIGGDQRAARPVEEVHFAHDAIADDGLVHLAGKYAAKARRSFAVAIVEPELFARFGSSEAVNVALRAVVEAANTVKHPAKTKRSSRGSKRTAA
jgi:hypothetical protein